MSLTQKMVAMNVATKNMTIAQLAEEFGLTKQRMHTRMTSPSYLYKFLEYCEYFGFQLVVKNEQGTIIPFTAKEAKDDVNVRRSKRKG